LAKEDYILWYDEPRETFLIVLKSSSTTATQLHAWMHVLLLALKLDNCPPHVSLLDTIMHTHAEMKYIVSNGFDEKLREAGWDIEVGALETKSGTRIKSERTSISDR